MVHAFTVGLSGAMPCCGIKSGLFRFDRRACAPVIDTPAPRRHITPCADGRMTAGAAPPEESPDSIRQRCRVTPGGGNPRDSATENRPPASARVRVKRWGKGPPGGWQQTSHGKPHREQCRIGTTRLSRQGGLAPVVRVGSLTPAAMRCAEEWSSKGATPEQNPAYRPSARF